MRWSAGNVLRWLAVAVLIAIIVVSVVRVRSCREARESRLDEILGTR
jgi:hypothetical protein